MPSNFACIFQLAYGTRDRRFPKWLDRWLLSRKQLGLLAFVIALGHCIITIILVSPAYYSSWFHPIEVLVLTVHNQTQIVVGSSLMTAKGELASLLGILALLCMSILTITSIPAISNRLNWREWRFVQSKVGTVTLLFAIGHVLIMAIPYWIRYNGRVKNTHLPIVTDYRCSITNAIEALEEFDTCLESIWPYDISRVNKCL
ncbi:unnamed protein product [Rotaria sp. Silwood1]|nr:unnamed protein product [Rotaria sp. Silwood1]